MKKVISSIVVAGLLGASTLSANTLSKNDSEFLGLTSTNAISLDSKEMVETRGEGYYLNHIGIAAGAIALGATAPAWAGVAAVVGTTGFLVNTGYYIFKGKKIGW